MRKLLVVVLSVIALWGGYWFVGSRAVQSGMTTWLSGGQIAGWDAGYSSLRTVGFPNRFDTTIRDPEISDPDSGIAWIAPFVQIFALSYKPNHIIAVWPNEQTITLPFQTLDVTSDDMRGSVVFEPKSALTLDRSSFEVDNLAVVSDLGWQSRAQSVRLASRQAAGTENAHDIFLQASNISPSEGFLARFDPSKALPGVLDTLLVDATLGFDAPWDRTTLGQRPPRITGLDLKTLQIQWGELEFGASGNLTLDSRGRLQGKLDITAKNWREIYQILLRMGLVQQNLAGTIGNVLEIIAAESGQPGRLAAPLVFRDGRMLFGPIPLGPAPQVTRR